MSSDSDEFDTSPSETPQFNGVFLAYLIVCSFLVTFFLLYLNRVFGSLVSLAIRTWSWHRYRIYVDIEALQVSLLGGRIFFTGLRYHGNNETFHVQHGYITWRYWLRRVRDVGIDPSRTGQKTPEESATTTESSGKPELPCRITVTLAGLEWFVYNRSPVYDSILAGLKEEYCDQIPVSERSSEDSSSGLRRREQNATEKSARPSSSFQPPAAQQESSAASIVSHPELPNNAPQRSSISNASSTSDAGDYDQERGKPGAGLPAMLQMFPVQVTCQTAALVMGNENTKGILVIKANHISGEVNATNAAAPDPYRQTFKIDFEHPIVEMKDNEDYKEDQVSRATKERHAEHVNRPPPKGGFFRRHRRRVLGRLRNLVPSWRKSVESFADPGTPNGTAGLHVPAHGQWQGLARYLDDSDQDTKTVWDNAEYAAVTTLIDSPAATLTVYWDVPGKVTAEHTNGRPRDLHPPRHVNRGDPPGWGMNLVLKGGTANYGPWADRQRADLQRVFFPGLAKGSLPAKILPLGAQRVSTQFKLYVELEEDVVLRIPVREGSKNWKWKGKEPATNADRPQQTRKQRARAQKRGKGDATPLRPAGWLDFKIAANATVSYSMDTAAGAHGYTTALDLDLPSTELSSSVNHELLWNSGAQRIICDLSTPLKWNGLRTWFFNVTADDMKLFLLRDHIFLLIDLVDDWATGPPADYLVFTPFRYHLNLELRNLNLYLNVNDGNIINKPTDFDENTYLAVTSPSLVSSVCIPIDKYRPHKTSIPFECKAESFALSLHLPPWNTQSSFLSSSKEIGHGENLVVEGSYNYNATTSPANTDTLILNVSGQSPTATLHGFIIRYFLKLKDNYFGDDIHFKTLDEYQELLQLKEHDPSSEHANRPPPKKSNDLDVVLNVRVDDPRVLLPTNLYYSRRTLQIETASLTADLRLTNYYMDLDLSVSPLSISLGLEGAGQETPGSAATSTQVFVDGLNVYGSRLFGLPPVEPTYMCNWDISVGAVTGECTADFLTSLAKAGRAFGVQFDDDENALVPYSAIVVYDVTFLRVAVQSVRLWFHVEEATFLLGTGAIDVKYNDWARTHYSRRADIQIPDLEIFCLDSEAAVKQRSRNHREAEANALLTTTIHLAIIGRKFQFFRERKLQQELVRREDQRTHRTGFLLLPGVVEDMVPDLVDPPAQAVPPIPDPSTLEQEFERSSFRGSSTVSSNRTRSLRDKRSFLSLSAASASSASSGRSVRSGDSESGGQALPKSITPASSRRRPSRDFSASASRYSSAHPPFGDRTTPEYHSFMAFSSQYFAPCFPLESVQTKVTSTRMPQSGEDGIEDEPDHVNFELDDVEPNTFDQDYAYSSTIIEFPSGLQACLTPSSVRSISDLITALQPSEPEDILDSLQIGSMSVIFGEQKRARMKGQIQDILLRVPHASVRFLNLSTDASHLTQDEQDQYDASVSRLSLALRSTSSVPELQASEKRSSTQKKTSLMLRFGSAVFSASERSSATRETRAAVLLELQRAMLSMGSKDIVYIDGEIDVIRGSTKSGKVDYLATLVHRTSVVATELGDLLGHTFAHRDRLVQYFVLALLREGKHVSDPTFLARPSAVLRSVSDHLRTYDSWKLCIHLRQIWSTLSETSRDQLKVSCLGNTVPAMPHGRQQAVAAFQKWRGWDLNDVANSSLVKEVFGAERRATKNESSDVPLLAAIRLKEVQMMLDPGSKQNRVLFGDLSIRLDQRPSSPKGSAKEGAEFEHGLTTVTVYCKQVAINLNWELCELAADILRLSNKSSTTAGARPSQSAESAPKPETTRPKRPQPAYHFVLGLGRGSIELDTINLGAKTLGQNLKASLLTQSADPKNKSLHFVLSCDAVTSRLYHRSDLLGSFQLQGPSIILSHELTELETLSCHTVKSTASSQVLTLDMNEDPIALLEVVDVLVKDELAQLYQLKQQLPSAPTTGGTKTRIAQRLSSLRFNTALFLDEYTISLPLLQSLNYRISGVVARAAVAANLGKGLIFDFDIKENSHEMHVDTKGRKQSVSILRIPPTNGRITSQIGSTKHLVTVLASVELIQLDASAVYSLLGALNRPQISNALGEIQQQAHIIQDHLHDIVGPPAEPEEQVHAPSNEAPKLAYTAHLTLAGLEVFGKTSLKSGEHQSAYMLFSLDGIHFQAANQRGHDGPRLAQPELCLNFRQIVFDIQKGSEGAMRSCGSITLGALMSARTKQTPAGTEERSFNFTSNGLDVQLSPETVSTVIEVTGYMGDKIKDLDISREQEYLRKIRQSRPRIAVNDEASADAADFIDSFLSSIAYQFEIRDTQISWFVGNSMELPSECQEDLVLSIKLISLGTRKSNSARLSIEDLQLQMVPPGHDLRIRSPHSALLPEVVFNVAYVSAATTRRLAFQAVGKSLDLRVTSGFIIPAANLNESIRLSVSNVQKATAHWATNVGATKDTTGESSPPPRPSILGTKRIESLLVDADFAGAVVYVSGKKPTSGVRGRSRNSYQAVPGKYGQFNPDESGSSTVLRSPGLAWKIEYRDNGQEDPTLFGEIKIDASSNTLYPSVVPLIMELTSSVKEVVADDSKPSRQSSPPPPKARSGNEDNILTVDPNAVLGRLKLNLGLRICRQEFSLSCQPIARVTATAYYDDVYFTANTIRSMEQGNFFAISGTFTNLQASVQHVYSRESTGSFEIKSIVLSLMNSKHVSGTSGVSALLKVSPMSMSVNAKQLQDFLLFREIWYPKELRQGTAAPVAKLATEASQGHLVQQYQKVAATAAFPWTATISIASLDVSVDLGQAVGKSTFAINDFWVSSKKTSDWEQNLCLGFEKIGVDCTGRLSGYVALQSFQLRTSIQWPEREAALNETPLIQASICFSQFRLKTAFDYQAFLVADITTLEFIMYNVRRRLEGSGDRLVANLDGDAVQVFCTTNSAAQSMALYQAIQKLIQERRANFETSLKEIEKFMKRTSYSNTAPSPRLPTVPQLPADDTVAKSPISLDTDVVVVLKALNLGVFPNTFSDHQVFKLEALGAQARFAASMERRRIHSILDLTLGQLRIGLAGVRNIESPKTLSELSVEDVTSRATGSRGGTILKVPKVQAVMQTWQKPDNHRIDYIFKSAFEGKVEVGWNYSRISYIRGMWAKHNKSLQQTWGRELPLTAIRVTGMPEAEGEEEQGQQKITAEVNVPQSKYDYVALEPPIIETPQLRDMGEATPPLEWIGLHRDRLPNLTHQIVIVSLLELAGEVEDAYSRILGSSS
ncbi:fermentation associated protein [Sodiomyces alkalinus F11]|uniref:Fermentation associated protein n=1 Tax=Sodiomyces alkalinus (strain CBS 110278 / VKM F-3762 / F11) TaxID=1314773 RepID=A0A3N2PVX0_SODAK|nr:fermentation associated protein [Sodiomyces alkalinus F11]ROT38645.1 fermentation associated protein [Sodiomyces alkalinus F11]